MSKEGDTTGSNWRDDIFVSIALPAPLALALAGERALVSLSVADITPDRMEGLRQTLMGCELFAGNDDAFAIISALSAAGASGQLTVLAPPLPDPMMVERELQKVAGRLSVTLTQA